MKVLMIAPPSGGIDVYVNSISDQLRKFGYSVDTAGSKKNEIAYDVEKMTWKSAVEVKNIVEKIVQRINFKTYDFVAFNYGKNDIEQYIPVILENKKINIKTSIYFTHFLSWNLFSDYVVDKISQKKVENAVYTFFDKYLFFGTFAKKYFENKSMKKLNSITSFLPETHYTQKISNQEYVLFNKKYHFTHSVPVVFMPGFSANYKDYNLLLEALSLVSSPLRVVIVGRGWKKRLGFEHKFFNLCEVYLLDEYISSKEYKYLTSQSLFGIFPYRQPNGSTEVFQASGTLPNFIYEGKANIVLNEASMPEYLGNGGVVVQKNKPDLIANAINELLVENNRTKYEKIAIKNKERFSLSNHAKDIASLLVS